MYELIFLAILGLLWTLFATIQDLRVREVSNWLNFSLLAIALSFRAFVSLEQKSFSFFLIGLLGTLCFTALAYALYYSRAFAGGDAKLLIAYGALLPFQNLNNLLVESLLFVFILFLGGALYSMLYSTIIVYKNYSPFKKEFLKRIKNMKIIISASVVLAVISMFIPHFSVVPLTLTFVCIALFLLAFAYTKSLEHCMIKLVPPKKLTEGDWLLNDIRINKNTLIKKTVHGLTKEDIKKLVKAKKSATIKEGIPFVPAFLLALVFTEFFALTQSASLLDLFLHFFQY